MIQAIGETISREVKLRLQESVSLEAGRVFLQSRRDTRPVERVGERSGGRRYQNSVHSAFTAALPCEANFWLGR